MPYKSVRWRNELQEVINRRIETSHSSQGEIDLQNHLYDLRTLYTNIQHYHMQVGSVLSRAYYKFDPNYPREDFDEFLLKAIEQKKRLIKILRIDTLNRKLLENQWQKV